ncbi:MAG: DUF3800 domain-containing protein [Actinomyces bowdenii]|nr:DUF3800 domain-containing protein [Actinomyces bowdenii]
MLLAYIDETGEPGAFVSPEHSRYNTSAAFGYAGFIIPETSAREFGAHFQQEKRTLFASEIANTDHPGRWERKGASIFRPSTPAKYPQQLRVFNALVKRLRHLGGHLFYYADEKPAGTPKQTSLDVTKRESQAMEETLNRLARHADQHDANILALVDWINEKDRIDRLPRMYSHILGRAGDHPEMRRIIEPPMHIDSKLSAGIQFADWVAACITRGIDYQLLRTSRHKWITDATSDNGPLRDVCGSFTHESKLHLYQRNIGDIHHSEIFHRRRSLHPSPQGHLLGASIDPDTARKMRGIADSSRRRPSP